MRRASVGAYHRMLVAAVLAACYPLPPAIGCRLQTHLLQRGACRYGLPVDGLQPGSLLVAAPGLEDPQFKQAVVLITHMGRRGVKGVVLTQVCCVLPGVCLCVLWGRG